MKKNLFFLFALLSFTSAMAQHADSHKEFDAYAKIYQEGSGYMLKAPDGYVDAGHEAFFWSPQSHLNWHNIKTYRMRLYSPADEVLIIFPVESYLAFEAHQQEDNGVIEYVLAAKQYPINYTQPDPQTGKQSIVVPKKFHKYYTKEVGSGVREWFNADEVYSAEFELLKPFDGIYTHAKVISFHGKQRFEVVCFFKEGKAELFDKVFNDLKGNIKLSDDMDSYTYRTNSEAQVKIVEMFGNGTSDKYANYTHIPEIPKKPKKYKEHLTLSGGTFNIFNREDENYDVSVEAFGRLTIITKEYGKSYIHQKSGKEVNISEDLYQQIVAFVERNNSNQLKMRERSENNLPGRIK